MALIVEPSTAEYFIQKKERKTKKKPPKEEHAETMEPFDQTYGLTNSKEYFNQQLESSDSE